jgi:hypothetical protein
VHGLLSGFGARVPGLHGYPTSPTSVGREALRSVGGGDEPR